MLLLLLLQLQLHLQADRAARYPHNGRQRAAGHSSRRTSANKWPASRERPLVAASEPLRSCFEAANSEPRSGGFLLAHPARSSETVLRASPAWSRPFPGPTRRADKSRAQRKSQTQRSLTSIRRVKPASQLACQLASCRPGPKVGARSTVWHGGQKRERGRANCFRAALCGRRSICRPVGRLVGQPASQPASKPASRLAIQQTGRPKPARWATQVRSINETHGSAAALVSAICVKAEPGRPWSRRQASLARLGRLAAAAVAAASSSSSVLCRHSQAEIERLY